MHFGENGADMGKKWRPDPDREGEWGRGKEGWGRVFFTFDIAETAEPRARKCIIENCGRVVMQLAAAATERWTSVRFYGRLLLTETQRNSLEPAKKG
jgi:hypothetical protein